VISLPRTCFPYTYALTLGARVGGVQDHSCRETRSYGTSGRFRRGGSDDFHDVRTDISGPALSRGNIA
jgi:hypothetical protein